MQTASGAIGAKNRVSDVLNEKRCRRCYGSRYFMVDAWPRIIDALVYRDRTVIEGAVPGC